MEYERRDVAGVESGRGGFFSSLLVSLRTEREMRPVHRLWWLTAVAWLFVPKPGMAQKAEEAGPVLPAGVAVVVLPVQSVRPTAGGAWLGGNLSSSSTLEALSAELTFAFAEERGAKKWAMPGQVVDRASRNPLVGVDPNRLAYQGLLGKPDTSDQLYEPLHGQLRKLAALFGTRFVVLPLAVWYRSEPVSEPVDSVASLAGGPQAEAPKPKGRGVLLLALVDVRRSAVMWHGTIEGDLADLKSSALLATLAQRVAHQLSPS